ncbi:MAG: hotdog domain-containing protein [Acidimicrobiia bacterium]
MDVEHDRPQVGFTSELGLHVSLGDDPDTLAGRAEITPELCIPEAGVLRPSVLLTWADILTGSLANERTLPKICMTVDLGVRVAGPIAAGTEITAVGRILKSGRTVSFTETTFSAAGAAGRDEIVAISLGTFVASPRPQDTATSAFAAVTTRERATRRPPSAVAEMLGSRVIAPGVVEVPRSPRILNWADTVQGGAVAAAAEEAVLALDGPSVPVELEVRYLGAVRVGPMRATARRFGEWMRVEVHDIGNDDRMAAVATARGA